MDILRMVPRRLHKAFQEFDVKRVSDTLWLGQSKMPLKMLSKNSRFA